MLDADEDCAADLGARLVERIHQIRSDIPSLVVLPTLEFETWFVAAAESLEGVLGAVSPADIPENPEESRARKRWIQSRLPHYSETVDQPRMTAAMDIELATRRSRSFARLRERLAECLSRAD